MHSYLLYEQLEDGRIAIDDLVLIARPEMWEFWNSHGPWERDDFGSRWIGAAATPSGTGWVGGKKG